MWSSKWSGTVTCQTVLLVIVICVQGIQGDGNSTNQKDMISIHMPNVTPDKDDAYLCTALKLNTVNSQGSRSPNDIMYIRGFVPNSSADRAHHMILFTCDDVFDYLLTSPTETSNEQSYWDCAHHSQACKNMRIVYAWAKNAPATELPSNVGFAIGDQVGISYLVLQVHYAHKLSTGVLDRSGFHLHVNTKEPEYLAGILLMFRGWLEIPPQREAVHGDMNCYLTEITEPLHPFAFRVHTHAFGTVVTGYKFEPGTKDFTIMAKGNPQWPQAFYPMVNTTVVLRPNDTVAARCTYNTKSTESTHRIGSTSNDEMCNLYIMFYTKSRVDSKYITCGNDQIDFEQERIAWPEGSDVPLPRNKTLEEHAKHAGLHQEISNSGGSGREGVSDSLSSSSKHTTKKRPGISMDNGMHSEDIDTTYDEDADLDPNRDARQFLPASDYKEVKGWPTTTYGELGQVSGVTFDTHGNVVIFHRGDHVWDGTTFDQYNKYKKQSQGPISIDTVYILSPGDGTKLFSWGKNIFYMPHGITVDSQGSFWLTDVAMHQVFKYPPGSTKPSITLGEAFVPGSDLNHFCKPSAVAVEANGDFFVSDGYCNSRIIKYNKDGVYLLHFGRAFPQTPGFLQALRGPPPPPPYAFNLPHALTLADNGKQVCVADRENGRIQCFLTSNGTYTGQVSERAFGGKLFSVAYANVNGGTLFAVNGAQFSSRNSVQGFVISMTTKKAMSVFGTFTQPHDIAVTPDGDDIYVVEIAKPYRVIKLTRRPDHATPYASPPDHHATQLIQKTSPGASPEDDEDSDSTTASSVVLMALLTIPLLILITVGALCRACRHREHSCLNSCCGLCQKSFLKQNQTKSFAEFFPPSAGFEKLRMEDEDDFHNDSFDDDDLEDDDDVDEFIRPPVKTVVNSRAPFRKDQFESP